MNLNVSRDTVSAHELMARALRDGGPLASEYPLVFEPSLPGRVITITDEGKVVSACSVLQRSLVLGDERIPVGLIGSVATEASHRGRGLGTRLLAEAERYLADEGAICSMLWANDPAFYEARGYQPVGWELDYILPRELVGGLPSAAGVEEACEGDAVETHRLYRTHNRRAERTLAEHQRLAACPDMRTLVCRREGEVVAYACLGRGADFHGTIHEWAGQVDDILSMTAHFLASDSERLCLIAPPGSGALRAALGARGVTPVDGILAMGKSLDRRALAQRIIPFVVQGSLEVIEQAPQRPRVRARGHKGEMDLSDEQLLGTLFPARGLTEHEQRIDAATGVQFEQVARHPFLWGLDSI